MICGCAAQINSGTVTAKQFVPAHTESNLTFTGETWINHVTHHPDAWYITFEGKGEDDRHHKRTVSVSKRVYDHYKNGDWFSVK